MARARNIKPGFFKNELLVDLPFEVRLLFVGLWTMADREGRLEDRPTKIKMELFPADSVDVNAGLQGLHDSGFICRYEADGKRFIQVLAWAKHQNPHVKEAKSTIPEPGEHGSSTVLAPAKADTSPADSLIPDSLKEPTEANASDADASPQGEPPDPIWGSGLSFLRRKGVGEKQARPLLGKLRKACGDIETGALLARAEADDITDPIPWLMAAAANKARAGPAGQQQMGKTAQGLMALEDFGSGLDQTRNFGGAAAADVLGPGANAGSGSHPADRRRLA